MAVDDCPVLVVDLHAVQANFCAVQTIVGPSVVVSAVVKSDAYGLGIDRVGPSLHEAGCSSFFVANLHEALRLRERLPDVDVFVLTGIKGDEIPSYLEARLAAVCNTPAEVTAATAASIPYALNLETGFSRLGLRLNELRSLAHANVTEPLFVMSHLACADEPSHPQNLLQRRRFVGMSEVLGAPVPRSLVASSGLFLGSPYHFDRVRVGSALYGLNTAALEHGRFAPVIRLSARLIDIKSIPPGEGVGYMGTFRTERQTILGIAGIGYKHGVAWQAANRLCAEIGGYIAPVVGRVSMEYSAIDLTDVPVSAARVGAGIDFVSPTLRAERVAVSASTVPQEILVRAGASCRRYYRNGFGRLE